MSEQRLTDANKIKFIEYINGSVNVEKEVIDRQPTIDPETLPIVQELRKENDELKQRIVFWNRGMISEQRKEIAELKAKLAECETVKHGHWIPCEDLWGNIDPWKCSSCGCDWTCIDGTPEENNMKFCPECGAKMDEEE